MTDAEKEIAKIEAWLNAELPHLDTRGGVADHVIRLLSGVKTSLPVIFRIVQDTVHGLRATAQTSGFVAPRDETEEVERG